MTIVESCEKLMKETQERLKNHDWWYMMSDSNSVHFKGEKDIKEIFEMLSFFDFEYAQKTYEKYAPENFRFTTEDYNAGKKGRLASLTNRVKYGKISLGDNNG